MRSFKQHIKEAVEYDNWIMPDEDALRLEYKVEYEIKPLGRTGIWPTYSDFKTAVENAEVRTIKPNMSIGGMTRTRDYEDLLDLIKGYASYPEFRNEKTLKNLYTRIKEGKPLNYPMVIDYGDRYRILAGNTRANVAFQLGVNPKALFIKPTVVNESLSDFSQGSTVRLTHFSKVDGLDTIDPEKRFTGADRSNRDVRAITSSTLPRSYWGIGVGQEGGYNPSKDTKTIRDAGHTYVVDFPTKYLYDYDLDPEDVKGGLKKKAEELRAAHPNGMLDRSDLYKWMDETIRDMGYKGVTMKNPSYGQAAYLWVPVKVEQVN